MDRNDKTGDLPSDAAFAELLGSAEPRVQPPEADERIVREAVHAEWQRLTGRRVRRQRLTSLALAASVLVAVFATLNLLRDPVIAFDEQVVATVERHVGTVSVRAPDGGTAIFLASIEGSDRSAIQGSDAASPDAIEIASIEGSDVAARDGTLLASIEGSDVVETGDASGLALGWHGGGSLRLDANTTVAFEARDRIHLMKGRIYFDSVANPVDPSSSSAGPADFAIRTERGLVRHLGTQYMTAVSPDALVVTVREGRVSVVGDAVNARASQGEQLSIDGSGSAILGDALVFGAQWAWIEKTSPAVDLDGQLVADALRWVGRESGRTIHYASDAAEQLATTVRIEGLRGARGLEPSEAMRLFLLTTGDLVGTAEGGTIVVSMTR